MRQFPLALTALAALTALGACATAEPGPSYAEELSQLEADCRERGGVLTALPGAVGPTPATDFSCTIPGGASRLDHD